MNFQLLLKFLSWKNLIKMKKIFFMSKKYYYIKTNEIRGELSSKI